MSNTEPQAVIAIYRVQTEREDDFFQILRKHYPALKRAGLVTDDVPIVYRGAERDGRPIVFEIFKWKNAESPQLAHQLPEVMAVWEPMGTMVEERDGKPKLEFPHVSELVDFQFDAE